MTGPTEDRPAWRVGLLRPDGTPVGEGILLSDRRFVVNASVLSKARLGVANRVGDAFVLQIQYGEHEPELTNVSLVAERDGHAVVDMAIPTSFSPAPLSLKDAERRMPVLVALSGYKTRSLRRNERWILANVGDSRSDGQFMLDPRTESPAARARLMDAAGAVIDSNGDVVGIATDRKMRSIDWLNAVRSIDSRRSSWQRFAEPTAAMSRKEQEALPTKNDQADDTPPSGPTQPLPRLATDAATVEDRLARTRYVDAIATFLRHADTRPPLTIGIYGSWGAGKTSLMRMVQNVLDPGAASGAPRRLRYGQRRRHAVTNGEVVRAAKRPPEPGTARAFPVGRVDDWRPTVWFNPWAYQNGDQVWAGLAHAIISQVTERLPRSDRERFWLRLNLKRTDTEKIRRRWYGIVARRILPVLLWWLLGLAAATVTLFVLGWLRPALAGVLHDVARWAGLGGGFAAVTSGVGGWLWARLRPAAPAFDRLLHQPPMVRGLASDLATAKALATAEPGYDGKLGFLHLVQSDMRRVLDLVASTNRPLVVFVDDLDRCSSGTVAQVVEAINLFLAGEFGNCVFVLGMEPTTVSTSVSAAYRDLAAEGADLGWRFLAKFVQLPIRIPEPDPDTELTNYLDHLLDGRSDEAGRGSAPAERPSLDEVLRSPPSRRRSAATATGTPRTSPSRTTGSGGWLARLFPRRRRSPDVQLRPETLILIKKIAGERTESEERAVPDAVQEFAQRYSDRDAVAPLRAALPSLGTGNPREVKRYVNLFRFYTFLAERLRLRGAAVPEPASIAKLAAFTIRWPQLVSTPGAASAAALTELESAAAGEDDHWHELLAAICPGLPAGTDGALREFLRSDPAIGADGFRLR